MQDKVAVFSHDGRNLDGSQLPVTVLLEHLWTCRNHGHPLLFGHDYHHPIGWSYPLAIYIEPGLSRLVGIVSIVDSQEEMNETICQINRFLHFKVRQEEENFIKLESLIQSKFNGEQEKICSECVSFVEPDLAVRVFPDLFQQQDQDGLIPIDKLKPISPGVFRIGELAVFAHPFFRRRFSRLNSLNSQFLRRIQTIQTQGVIPKVALDRDMIGLASNCHEKEEFEYWWGPKFHEDLASIPPGITRHEASKEQYQFQKISRTEFWWQSRNGEHILEVEELCDIPSILEKLEQYGCRYVHSIVDEATRQVIHFDGAVRIYLEEQMIERLDKNIAEAGRNTNYKKLWRLNDHNCIDIETWKNLLSDYFRNNELVGEYLGAETKYKNKAVGNSQPVSAEALEIEQLINKLIPCKFNAGEGVRISLACHLRTNIGKSIRNVISIKRILLENENIPVFEAGVIELRKALKRLGADLPVPPNSRIVNYEDYLINLPPILHSEFASYKDVCQTLDAIETLVVSLCEKKRDAIMNFCIGLPVNDRDIYISVLGHVQDIMIWLSQSFSRPPNTREGINSWLLETLNYLYDNFSKTPDKPPLFATVTEQGFLEARRVNIDAVKDIRFRWSSRNNEFDFEFEIPPGDKSLIKLLSSGYIQPAIATIVEEAKCTKCSSSYFMCDCSQILDNDVRAEIVGRQDEFPFWTSASTSISHT